MALTARLFEYGVVKPLAPLGLDRFGLAVFDRLDLNSVSLRLLKWAMEASKKSRNGARRARYIQIVLERFPQNVAGYIASAEYFVAKNDPAAAGDILRRAPKSRKITEAAVALKLDMKPAPRSRIRAAKSAAQTVAGPVAKEGAQHVVGLEAETKSALRKNPLIWEAYERQAKVWVLRRHPKAAARLLANMPKQVPRGIGYYLFLATCHEQAKDHVAALKVLLSAQRNFPNERRLLFRISDLYRADGQGALAHGFMNAARICYPVYGAVRQLSFEVDHELLEDANLTLDWIAEFGEGDILKFMPIINRVSAYFPSRIAELEMLRQKARVALTIDPCRSALHLNKMVELAIKGRWLKEARRLAEMGTNQGVQLPAATLNWLEASERHFAGFEELLELAHVNEADDQLIGIRDGMPMGIRPDQCNPKNTVEMFIPSVFFADPLEEKPSYATVRSVLLAVYKDLLARKDIIVVPRHQYNWRYVHRMLAGSAVSYHTHGTHDDTCLHIQESPFAGRCTLDNQGFAGYSSIAADYRSIEAHSKGVKTGDLKRCQLKLYSKYVEANVSKYEQSAERVEVDGDYVFVALQIPTDVVASLAHVTGIDLVRTVAEYYRNSGTRVVVKRHPYCDSFSVQATIESLASEGLIVLSDASVHDLISGAKTVFTVNSGVGLEALVHLKPVVVTGSCEYAYAVAGQAESKPALQLLLETGVSVDEEKTLKFLHYYVERQTLEPSDLAAIKARINEWLARAAATVPREL